MAYDNNIYAKIINGDLTTEEKNALIESGEWDEIKEILEATENLSLPKRDTASKYEALLVRRSHKRKNTSKVYFIISSIAAILILVVSFTFIFDFNKNTSIAKYGEELAFDLSKNVSVILNDGSRTSFSKNDENNINLIGEAFFEVTPGIPFKVKTPTGTVQVLGTKFNVKAWNDELSVECYSGRVSVKMDGQERVLTASTKVKSENGRLSTIESINHNLPAWQDGISKFESSPLVHVFEELERQFAIEVKGKDKQDLFSGQFSHLDLETALNQICVPMNISYKIERKNIVILEN